MKSIKKLYERLQSTNTFARIDYHDNIDSVEVYIGDERFIIDNKDNKEFNIVHVPYDRGYCYDSQYCSNTINNKELYDECVKIMGYPKKKKVHIGTELIKFKYGWNNIEFLIDSLQRIDKETFNECYVETCDDVELGIIRVEKYDMVFEDDVPESYRKFNKMLVQYINKQFDLEMLNNKQDELNAELCDMEKYLEQFEEFHKLFDSIKP